MAYPLSATGAPHVPAVAETLMPARPAWALVGVVCGTIAAVLLLPESDHHVRGALLPAGLALTLGLLVGPAIAAWRNPVAAFRVEHLLMLGIVYWVLLDAVQGGARLRDVSHDAVSRAFLATGVFAGFVWLGSCVVGLFRAPGRLPAGRDRELGAAFLFAAGVCSFALGMVQPVLMCGFSPDCLLESLLAPRFASPWYSGPGIEGFNTVLSHLRYFGYLVLPIAAALLHTERKPTWRSAVLLALGAVFLLLLVRDGGRRSVGTVIGATVLVWVLLRGSLRLRDYITLALVGVGLLSLMQTMLVWRNVGVVAAAVAEVGLDRGDGLLRVDRNLEWMAHVMQVVPERHPHTGAVGIAYIVGHPIPRSVWRQKPVARGIDLPSLTGRRYGPGFSWTCSAVGDLYLIGGFLAIGVGGLLYGIAGNLLSRLLARRLDVRAGLIYGLGAMTLFVSLRAVHEVVLTGLMVLAAWALLMTRAVLLRHAVAAIRAYSV